jgi:2-amino-4-hydroxy-6-hydroxymethyldihydropteridine diphosphokinase
MAEVFLGLGSNLGDRAKNISRAIRQLKSSGKIKPIAISSYYETEPIGVQSQGNFYNCVMKMKTELDPHGLLNLVKSIEATMGRQPGAHMLPRAIDIDILLYDDLDIDSADLRIPHSRLKARRFVLEPLLEIAPATIDPKTRKPLREFLKNVSSQIVRKVTGGA